MLDQDTKRRIDTARQILVGKVPDPKSQVEQITTALIYKFMDDMDRQNEELGSKASFLVGKLREFAWGRLLSKELSGEQRIDLYVRALSEFTKSEQIPPLFRTIFKGTFLPYRDSETLNLFLKEINGFTYDDSEELGNSFEYLLSVLGAQGKAGQFRTPRHIIDFIVEVVNPKKEDKILDPACGTAGFLISAYKHIKHRNSSNFKVAEYVPSFSRKGANDVALIEMQSNGDYRGDKLTPDARKKLATNIIGYDISPDMVRLSLVNMYLHGFNTPQIFEYDTLAYEDRWADNFDVILANPPFMSPKGGIRPHKRFRISANRSEVLFVDYIAEHLTLKGRAGVIVPEGIIFQSANAYKDLRKMLIEDNFLWAVVSLPAGVFKPYSGVKTSILFFDRERAKQNDEILFVKVSNDGFDLGDQRRAIDKNDLPESYRVLQEWQKGDVVESNIAQPVKKRTILESGDYNLTGDRYKSVAAANMVRWPMVRLGDVAILESGSRQKGGAQSSGFPSIGGEQIDVNGRIRFDKMKYISERHYQSMKKGKLRNGDVLVVKDGATTGKTGLWCLDTQAAVNEHVFILRANEQIDARLLYYIVRSQFFQTTLKPFIKGIIGGISLEVKGIQIPLPPLEVQKEIVAELDGYQRVIEGARQIVENWRPTIKIDPKWKVVTLGEVCEVNSGGTPSRNVKEYWGGDIPWLGSTACKNQVVSSATEYITTEGLHKSAAKLFRPRTTLIALVGATIGKTAFLNFEASTNQNIAGLYPKDDSRLMPEYLFWISQSLYPEFVRLGEGKFRMANLTFIRELKVPLPPVKEQQNLINVITKEQEAVRISQTLIKAHEQKIKNKIAEVWGEMEEC